MREFVSPKQVARAIGVSESSVKRWCDQGSLPFFKTDGGHRRLLVGTVLEFVKTHHHHLKQPELLGLPISTGSTHYTIDQAVGQLRQVLEQGNEELTRQILFDLFLANLSIAEIGDQVIRPVFQSVGQAWECGDMEVYQERRACQVCLHALHDLRSQLPQPETAAPLALGATLSGDNYQLPILLVEMVLRQSGLRAQSYGTNLTVETLMSAVETSKPQLFWLSISYSDDASAVIDACRRLNDLAKRRNVAFLLGGSWIQAELVNQLQYTVHCNNLRDVENFAQFTFPQQSDSKAGRN